jgi:hypothetical protein
MGYDVKIEVINECAISDGLCVSGQSDVMVQHRVSMSYENNDKATKTIIFWRSPTKTIIFWWLLILA